MPTILDPSALPGDNPAASPSLTTRTVTFDLSSLMNQNFDPTNLSPASLSVYLDYAGSNPTQLVGSFSHSTGSAVYTWTGAVPTASDGVISLIGPYSGTALLTVTLPGGGGSSGSGTGTINPYGEIDQEVDTEIDQGSATGGSTPSQNQSSTGTTTTTVTAPGPCSKTAAPGAVATLVYLQSGAPYQFAAGSALSVNSPPQVTIGSTVINDSAGTYSALIAGLSPLSSGGPLVLSLAVIVPPGQAVGPNQSIVASVYVIPPNGTESTAALYTWTETWDIEYDNPVGSDWGNVTTITNTTTTTTTIVEGGGSGGTLSGGAGFAWRCGVVRTDPADALADAESLAGGSEQGSLAPSEEDFLANGNATLLVAVSMETFLGASQDPTPYAVEFAFSQQGTTNTFYGGEWLSGTPAGQYIAQITVGPNATTTALTASGGFIVYEVLLRFGGQVERSAGTIFVRQG